MRKEEPTDLDAIKKLRIEYTGFLLKHELPFSLAPKIVQFNQNIIKKYGVATISQTNLSHTTAGQIAKSCISKTFKNAIYNDLKHSVFLLSFDDSAEHNGPSYLCTHARYVKDGKIEHKLLALNEIKDGSTGASLYDIIMKKNFSHSFSAELEKNLVGVVTDRGPNMFTTKEKGLSNRLQAKYQDIVVASDFCHSFNLILKEALQ